MLHRAGGRSSDGYMPACAGHATESMGSGGTGRGRPDKKDGRMRSHARCHVTQLRLPSAAMKRLFALALLSACAEEKAIELEAGGYVLRASSDGTQIDLARG